MVVKSSIRRKKVFVVHQGQATETEKQPEPTKTSETSHQARKKSDAPAPSESEAFDSPPKSSPTKAEKRAKIEAQTQKNRNNVNLLLERWPQLFNLESPKPLMIGIHRVLIRENLMSSRELKNALGAYTRRRTYLRMLAEGGPRYDPQGNEAGLVTKEQQAVARTLIKSRGDRKALQPQPTEPSSTE